MKTVLEKRGGVLIFSSTIYLAQWLGSPFLIILIGDIALCLKYIFQIRLNMYTVWHNYTVFYCYYTTGH